MNHIATDAEIIAAIDASPEFVTVTDSAHLAELLGIDEPEDMNNDEIETNTRIETTPLGNRYVHVSATLRRTVDAGEYAETCQRIKEAARNAADKIGHTRSFQRTDAAWSGDMLKLYYIAAI